jgi:hypothetical protein
MPAALVSSFVNEQTPFGAIRAGFFSARPGSFEQGTTAHIAPEAESTELQLLLAPNRGLISISLCALSQLLVQY